MCTSFLGGRLPLGSLFGAVFVLVGTAACDRTSPVGVDATGNEPVFYSHIPYSGCLAWEGPAFASVSFEKGSAELDDGDRAALDANIVRLNQCPQDGFHVVGLAVNEPKARHVAAARAQVVADYYAANGAVLFPGRMEVRSEIVVGGCKGKAWSVPCEQWRVTETLPF